MYFITDKQGYYGLEKVQRNTVAEVLRRAHLEGELDKPFLASFISKKPTIIIKDKQYDIYNMFNDMHRCNAASEAELVKRLDSISGVNIIFISKIVKYSDSSLSAIYYMEDEMRNQDFESAILRKIRVAGILESMEA